MFRPPRRQPSSPVEQILTIVERGTGIPFFLKNEGNPPSLLLFGIDSGGGARGEVMKI